MDLKKDFLGIRLDRRRNRRWLVAGYWGIAILAAVLFMILAKAHPSFVYLFRFVILFFLLFVNLPYLGLGIRRLFWEMSEKPEAKSAETRTLFDSASRGEKRKYPPMDEREKDRLGFACQISYGIVCALIFVALFMHIYGTVPRATHIREPLIWLTAFLIFNLPYSVLLWTEPDMEAPNEN